MSDKSEEHEVIAHGPLAEAIQEAAVEEDENIIDEVFITDTGRAVSSNDLVLQVLKRSMAGFDSDRIHKEANNAQIDIAKSIDGSTQSREEIGEGATSAISGVQVVEPPYPPELMSMFLQTDETHLRCVRVKVADSVSRMYELEPTVAVQPDYAEEPPEVPEVKSPLQQLSSNDKSNDNGQTKPLDALRAKQQEAQQRRRANMDVHKQSEIAAEVKIVRDFVNSCNEVVGFEGVLERAGMDYEAIGWAAIEVIRGRDKQIKRIAHLPADRIRVLRGWKGFVEIKPMGRQLDEETPGQHTYYQLFGQKVVSKTRKHPLTGKPVSYDPREDEGGPESADWSMIDRETGEVTNDFTKSANEILWIPKHHCATVYYGFADVVPAIGSLLANIHIRDYVLQFFEHNTIPRYAIIIEGAKLGNKVIEAITKYFSEHVKGKAHKTLIIPVPAMRGEVRVRFEKLSSENQESGFQETKKNNSNAIIVAHGVSPAIIGIAEHSELGSGKGLSQAEIYKDRVVAPTQRRWELSLNRMLSRGLGVHLIALKFNPLDIRDRVAEQTVLLAYLKEGVLTINQVRKRANLGEPIEGGDRAFIVVNNQIQFIDELTDMMSGAIEEANAEVESMRMEMEARDLEQQQIDQARMDEARQSQRMIGNAGAAKPTAGKPPAQ